MPELLIENGTVVTMNERREVIEDGAVVVDGDKIVDVGPTAEIARNYEVSERIDATDQVVLPGLITTHVHVSDILLRAGDNSDRELYDWLYNLKVPGISAMEPDEHEAAAVLYCREAIQSGVTTFNENAIGTVDSQRPAKRH